MRETDYLREQAHECRMTAGHAASRKDRDALIQLAGYYEREANRLDTKTVQALRYRL